MSPPTALRRGDWVRFYRNAVPVIAEVLYDCTWTYDERDTFSVRTCHGEISSRDILEYRRLEAPSD